MHRPPNWTKSKTFSTIHFRIESPNPSEAWKPFSKGVSFFLCSNQDKVQVIRIEAWKQIKKTKTHTGLSHKVAFHRFSVINELTIFFSLYLFWSWENDFFFFSPSILIMGPKAKERFLHIREPFILHYDMILLTFNLSMWCPSDLVEGASFVLFL